MPFSKNKNNNNNSTMPVLKLCFTPSGEIRRLAALDEPPKYETLEQHARRFFSIADGPITMTYHDDEEELVTLSTDEELADAFSQARAARGSLKLFVSPRFAEAAPPRAVHTGVTCDRSGMSPIVGPRPARPRLRPVRGRVPGSTPPRARPSCGSTARRPPRAPRRADRAARRRAFATAAPVRSALDAGPLLGFRRARRARRARALTSRGNARLPPLRARRRRRC